MTPAQRAALVKQRIEDVINGSELIREECNRIRNEFLTLGVPIDSELTSLLSHLQIDIVALQVKFGQIAGYKGSKMDLLSARLANPHLRMDNGEGPT